MSDEQQLLMLSRLLHMGEVADIYAATRAVANMADTKSEVAEPLFAMCVWLSRGPDAQLAHNATRLRVSCRAALTHGVRRLLRSARRLGERRVEAYAEFRLGECAFQAGDYTTAAELFTRAAAVLEVVGPATGGAVSQEQKWLETFSLPQALHSLGISRKQLDDTARAERAYLQSLAAHDAWKNCMPETVKYLGTPFLPSLRQQNCAHLVSLYHDSRAKHKLEARLRMWRALLEEENVECPSDSDAWLQYAQATATTAADAMDIVARARRIYVSDGPLGQLASIRAMRFTDAMKAAAAVLAKLGDTDTACELLTEAVADAARTACPDAWCMQARALIDIADNLKPDMDVFGDAANANRIASLRLYCRAAALFPAAARHGVSYCDLLDAVQTATQDMYCVAGAAALLSEADVVLDLPNGGVARLTDPLGRGFIALSEAILLAQEALYGAQAPRLAEVIFYHAAECAKYGDLVGAEEYSRRHVALCTSAFGAQHQVTRDAQRLLAHHAQMLNRVRLTMPEPTRTSREAVHEHAVSKFNIGRGVNDATEASVSPALLAAFSARWDAAHAAIQEATRGRRFACAACGAMPAPDAAPFQKCAACAAITYCGKECQRAHWRTHRVDCKKLRKPTPE